jgi:glycosyltransferase involved in cell wall biosynthesis
MKVAFGNVDFNSCSGPNSFAKRLSTSLSCCGVDVVTPYDDYDVLLAFIEWNYYVKPKAKLIQRLDGIWFNTAINWKNANLSITSTYQRADGVVFQSNFNKKLTEKYFGEKKSKNCIINNGIDHIGDNPTFRSMAFSLKKMVSSSGGKIFICASNWRPHKRLNDCIKLFTSVASEEDRLLVVGKPVNIGEVLFDHRIIWLGDIEQEMYRYYCMVSDYMLHLAWLDHCPNVVVEALMSSCPVICTDSGGTNELVKSSGIVLPDKEWDFEPHNLYSPPPLDIEKCAEIFNNNIPISSFERTEDLHIDVVAKKYIEFFKGVMEE